MPKNPKHPATLDELSDFLNNPADCGFVFGVRLVDVTPFPPTSPKPISEKTTGSWPTTPEACGFGPAEPINFPARNFATISPSGKHPPTGRFYQHRVSLKAAVETAGYGYVTDTKLREAVELLFIRRGVTQRLEF